MIREKGRMKQLVIFSAEEACVIRAIERALFILASAELNREQAIAIKETFTLPLGVLASRHNLKRGKLLRNIEHQIFNSG